MSRKKSTGQLFAELLVGVGIATTIIVLAHAAYGSTGAWWAAGGLFVLNMAHFAASSN